MKVYRYMLYIVLFILSFSLYYKDNSIIKYNINNKELMNINNSKDYIYLSDIPYMEDISYTSYSNITLDKNLDGNLITLIKDGKTSMFLKGILAHANSVIAYNLSDYNYDYLTTYIGVDASRNNNGNGVKFYVYISNDGNNWVLKDLGINDKVFKGNTECLYLKIPIKDVNYIKFVINDNASNGSDHSVLADAKLTNNIIDNKVIDYIKTVDEYDSIIKNYSSILNEEQKLMILQREFVNNVGYDFLNSLVSSDNTYYDMLKWLLTDYNNLNMYIMGGKPTGSYYNSLKVLNELYKNYKDDFNNKVYKTMAMSLSLTHSIDVGLWMQPNHPSNKSNAIKRFEIFKNLYDNNQFYVTDKIDITPWFESYTVEEMRFIMNNQIDDESIYWLHDYTQNQINNNKSKAWEYLRPHVYMNYVTPNYDNKIFHDLDKKDEWDTLFNGIFSKYNVTYSSSNDKVYKVWMNFKNSYNTGAVCGGISKTGSNIRATHGIPSAVIGQPGHAAIIYYSKDQNGLGYWSLDNDISGFSKSEKSERLLLGWGNDKRYVSYYNVPYMIMGQDALNSFDKYQESVIYYLLANSISNNEYIETMYKKSLESLNYNVDTWYSLINLYLNDSSKTESDYYNLAKYMSNSLIKYPLAYNDLISLLENKFTSNTYKFKYAKLKRDTLILSSKYDEDKQSNITRDIANNLLTSINKTNITFSFDGDNKGKIILNESNINDKWLYSINGGNTFVSESNNYHQLTDEELDNITSNNGIMILLNNKVSFITIKEQDTPLIKPYLNDLENRLIGIEDVSKLEWNIKDKDDKWYLYSDLEPIVNGNNILQIRYKRTGTYLQSKPIEYQFTDSSINNMLYIPIKYLSIYEYSSQSIDESRPFYAENIIDGNIFTLWHTDFRFDVRKSSIKPYIIIKLSEEKDLKALEFVQTKYIDNDPDYIKSLKVFTSIDGNNWTDVGSIDNCQKDNTFKKVIFDKSIKSKYVKLEMDTYDMFASLSMVNLYEDTTNKKSNATILYDKTNLVNTDVVASLVSDNNITILNNNGNNTYTFKENGKFTFEFINEYGNKDFITAIVDWIDKTPPSATIEYITIPNSNNVIARLITKEDITIINNGGKNEYVFNDNGKFTFEFMDKVSNINTLDANVTWISKKEPTVDVIYSSNDQDVTATIMLNDNYLITNNNHSNKYVFKENGEFVFEYVDEFGNPFESKVSVDWIDNDNTKNKVNSTNTKTTSKIKTKEVTTSKEKSSNVDKTTTTKTTNKIIKNINNNKKDISVILIVVICILSVSIIVIIIKNK